MFVGVGQCLLRDAIDDDPRVRRESFVREICVDARLKGPLFGVLAEMHAQSAADSFDGRRLGEIAERMSKVKWNKWIYEIQ